MRRCQRRRPTVVARRRRSAGTRASYAVSATRFAISKARRQRAEVGSAASLPSLPLLGWCHLRQACRRGGRHQTHMRADRELLFGFLTDHLAVRAPIPRMTCARWHAVSRHLFGTEARRGTHREYYCKNSCSCCAPHRVPSPHALLRALASLAASLHLQLAAGVKSGATTTGSTRCAAVVGAEYARLFAGGIGA